MGRRDFESVEEYAGHFVVIMLPCMHQDLLVPLAQFPAYGSSLDELRPRPYNGYELHGFSCSKCGRPMHLGTTPGIRRLAEPSALR